MKKILILIILLFAYPAWAVNPFDATCDYSFGSFVGGSDNALDSLNTNGVNCLGFSFSDGEVARIYNNSKTYFYVLDIDSVETDGAGAVPDPIEPDTGPGAWFLHGTSTPPYSSNITHTTFPDGMTDVEVWRTDLQAGEILTPVRLEIIKKGGGAPSAGFNVDIYDTGTTSILWATFAFGTGTPVDSGAGNIIIMRVNNSTGLAVDGCINFSYNIR
jgi:hypothetical protein